MRFVFGDCVFDLGTRQLVRAGQAVHVSPKALELLHLLMESRPNAVAKAAIHDRLWPATFVSESNLSTLVTELRQALGDDAREPRHLRTVHGFGYAFCGEAAEPGAVAPSPRVALRLVLGTREIPLGQGENVLGRDPASVVWIDSPRASRRHALIRVSGEEAVVEDLGSKNGTLVNGTRVQSPTRLRDGDRLEVGVAMTFRTLAAGDSTETGTAG
jgi:DNA-binding winged helix-turn-helix (wHTH) protein